MRKLREEWQALERTEAEANEMYRTVRRSPSSYRTKQSSHVANAEGEEINREASSNEGEDTADSTAYGMIGSATAIPPDSSRLSGAGAAERNRSPLQRDSPPPLDSISYSSKVRRYSNEYSAEVPSIKQMLHSAMRKKT
eukprot:gb/GECG01009056.1/.p1 GENE.gb/GECG01009056.1/~~gb/GECG01009056.1/.p1  ORF type:complete len:139 (+),score=24.80 gb/GECG01009056.1/:1-417(+)